jgi:ABC-2 type transport system permease protein
MKMNIYLQELKMSLRSFIYWTSGLILMVLLFMSMFSSISENAAFMNQVIANFPEGLVKTLGLSTIDLTELIGYYGFLFTYILMIGSIFSMKSGFSALSVEFMSKTTDFLLAKPVKRVNIVNSKILAVLTLLVIQSLIFTFASFIIISAYAEEPFNLRTFALISLSLILVQLFFTSLGLLLSIILQRVKTVFPITLGTVFGFFIIQMVNQSLADPKLSYITPFAYFDTASIITNGNYEYRYFIINAVLILCFTTLTYIIYQKKDMPSV